MKLPHRRQFLHQAAGVAALPVMSRIVWAQAYPTRPVRLIVGFPPGSATDLFGRLAGQWLSERFAQPFVIENRAGAGSNIAAEAVVKALPDGYTLLIITASNASNAALYDKLNFDLIRDIAPVASIARGMGVLVVHPSLPARTVPEFIAYAKANPGKINMASPGNGSTPHLYGELFKAMTGVNMIHVPYRSDVFSDLMGGQVQVYFPLSLHRSSSSGPGSCTRWQSPAQHAPMSCRTFRRWANLCRATKRSDGSALARRETRPTMSSASSTRR
jgi:tripartite-type tricarboxylate transporter receptor subunit TctC